MVCSVTTSGRRKAGGEDVGVDHVGSEAALAQPPCRPVAAPGIAPVRAELGEASRTGYGHAATVDVVRRDTLCKVRIGFLDDLPGLATVARLARQVQNRYLVAGRANGLCVLAHEDAGVAMARARIPAGDKEDLHCRIGWTARSQSVTALR